jgi:hypothetical protein
VSDHFKYDGTASGDTRYKIRRVVNLIPIEIEYQEEGDPEVRSAMGFIDYSTKEIRLPEGAESPRPETFRQAVLAFMMRRHLGYQVDVPEPDPAALDEVRRQQEQPLPSDKETYFGSQQD